MALTTVYTSNITNGTNNDAGSSYRMKITPSQGGRSIKVTFETSSTNGAGSLVAINCSAGVWTGTNYDTTLTPVELKFSGVSGFTITGNSTRIESDLTDIGATFGGGSRTLIVVIDWSGASTGNQISQVGDTQATDNNLDQGFFSGVATFNNATPGAPTSSALNHGEAIRFVKVDVGGGGAAIAKQNFKIDKFRTPIRSMGPNAGLFQMKAFPVQPTQPTTAQQLTVEILQARQRAAYW